MPQQLAIDYGPSDRARACWKAMLDQLRAIVARLGPKEVAFALDTSPSHLSDALAERDRRGPRAEWLATILLMSDDGERAALLSTLAAVAGYVVERAKPATPEEQLAKMEERVREQFGKAGEKLIQELRR